MFSKYLLAMKLSPKYNNRFCKVLQRHTYQINISCRIVFKLHLYELTWWWLDETTVRGSVQTFEYDLFHAVTLRLNLHPLQWPSCSVWCLHPRTPRSNSSPGNKNNMGLTLRTNKGLIKPFHPNSACKHDRVKEELMLLVQSAGTISEMSCKSWNMVSCPARIYDFVITFSDKIHNQTLNPCTNNQCHWV